MDSLKTESKFTSRDARLFASFALRFGGTPNQKYEWYCITHEGVTRTRGAFLIKNAKKKCENDSESVSKLMLYFKPPIFFPLSAHVQDT
jgi:hypothetical protein